MRFTLIPGALCFFAVLSSGFYRKSPARALWLANNDIDVWSAHWRSLFYFILFISLLLFDVIVEIAAVHMLRVAADYELYG